MSKLADALTAIPGCELDCISQLQSRDHAGSLKGRLFGTTFLITYAADAHALLSVHRTGNWWENALTTLRSTCTGFMGGGRSSLSIRIRQRTNARHAQMGA